MSASTVSTCCVAPERHVADAEAFIAAVQKACHERGLRLTPIRANVLRLLAHAGKPVKAYDLLAWVRNSKESGQVKEAGADAPPTVYRALDFLINHGFIHKLASVNAFVACHHPGATHSVPFLICDHCQQAIELEDRDIVRQLENRARAVGFKPQAQVLEVHGLCAHCIEGENKPVAAHQV